MVSYKVILVKKVVHQGRNQEEAYRVFKEYSGRARQYYGQPLGPLYLVMEEDDY